VNRTLLLMIGVCASLAWMERKLVNPETLDVPGLLDRNGAAGSHNTKNCKSAAAL
jgi:hypothetical protein